MTVPSSIAPAEAFRAEIAAKLGAAPKEIIGDGRIRRFATGHKGRDDNGWYIFHDDQFPAGVAGDWRTGAKFKWSARETQSLTPDELMRHAEVKAERKKQQQAAEADAIAAAKERWSNAAPAKDDHPYLF